MNTMPPSNTRNNSLSFLNFFNLAFTVIAIVLLFGSAAVIGFKVGQDAVSMTRPMFANECEVGSPGPECIMTVTGVVTSIQESTVGGADREVITIAVVPEEQKNERRFVNGFLNMNLHLDSGLAKEDTVQAVAIDRKVYFLVTDNGGYIYGDDFSGARASVGLYAVAVVALASAVMGTGYALRRGREQGWRKVTAGNSVSSSSRSFAFGWSVIAFTLLSAGVVLALFEADLVSPDMTLPIAIVGTLAGALCSVIAVRWQQGRDRVESAPQPAEDTGPTLGSRLREQL